MYQVIARKWRPKTFDEVTGQEHITRTLRNAIEHERLHHAYLFSGARGVGKTTTARLLAKALNCRKTESPNIFPCDSDDADACPSCIEIGQSRSIDVLEFDAASNTQVDKIREIILESVNVAPARDRNKIFIIDEVHMLSASSFNALLKTVEEPPPNVVFIMATTELHKVPDTIISRCQQFEFRTISNQKIFERLKLIADTEAIPATEAALREIARSGEGSMRDAQSNFDQVISFADGSIDAPEVAAALGIAGSDMLTRTIGAISDRDPKIVLDVVAELIARGHDLRNFSRDLLALFRDLLVFKVSNGDASLVDRSVLTAEEMQEHSTLFSESDILRFFHSLAETETKLKEATQPRYVLEIGLVKLIEMRRAAAIEDILTRLIAIENSLPQAVASAPPEKELAAAVSEKKTLISDEPTPAAVDLPPELRAETAVRIIDSERESEVTHVDFPPEPEPAVDTVRDVQSREIPTVRGASQPVDLTFLDSMPVKLAVMESEELEHVDDSWLDSAFEEKLVRSGDDLRPLSLNTEQLKPETEPRINSGNGNAVVLTGNGTAAAIAADYVKRVPEPEVIPVEIPELPENATDAELLLYAERHPAVRRVLRGLRAKIVSVRRV